jgi:hypothetical protein
VPICPALATAVPPEPIPLVALEPDAAPAVVLEPPAPLLPKPLPELEQLVEARSATVSVNAYKTR